MIRFFDLRCIVLNIVLFSEVVFRLMLLNSLIALDVGYRLLLWFIAFSGTFFAVLLSDFLDLFLDTVWTLFIQLVDMIV